MFDQFVVQCYGIGDIVVMGDGVVVYGEFVEEWLYVVDCGGGFGVCC